jgi:hypothetical protein
VPRRQGSRLFGVFGTSAFVFRVNAAVDKALRRSGLNELIRLGGIEDPVALCPALNWTLHEGILRSDEELSQWRDDRKSELGL